MIRARVSASVSVSRKPRASGDDPVWQAEQWQVLSVNPARAGMIQAAGNLNAVAGG